MNTNHQYIYGQCNAPVASLCYGKAKKPVAEVGCGAVALYNAMTAKGIPVEFENLLREMEALKMPWLFGVFGTKPLSLRRFLRKNNIPFKNYISLQRFKHQLTDNHVGIVCAWNPRFYGIHFYCVLPQDGQLYSLNYISSNQKQPFDDNILSVTRFIIGYIL
ncbi:MAG: hypothetical protein IJ598_13775 [Ruminococcus sp.]|nr:hypothetical protein [Ruminococcus sp.]